MTNDGVGKSQMPNLKHQKIFEIETFNFETNPNAGGRLGLLWDLPCPPWLEERPRRVWRLRFVRIKVLKRP
jgi:hypothetical protein